MEYIINDEDIDVLAKGEVLSDIDDIIARKADEFAIRCFLLDLSAKIEKNEPLTAKENFCLSRAHEADRTWPRPCQSTRA